MLYFLYGNDPTASLKCLNDIVVRFEHSGENKIPRLVDCEEVSKEILEQELSKQSLFGGKGLIILKHVFASPDVSVYLSKQVLNFKKSTDVIVIWERTRPIFKGEGGYASDGEKLYKLLLKESKKREFELKKKKDSKTNNKNKIYSFTDSFFKGNKKDAIAIYSELISDGLSSERIFWTVVWQIRSILIVGDMLRIGIPENQIARRTKLHPYVVKKSAVFSKKISMNVVSSILKRLISIDERSKKTGDLNESLFFWFILKGVS